MSAEPEILNRESAVIRGSRLSLERGRADPLFRSSLKSSRSTVGIASALNDNGRVQAPSGNHSNGTGVIENGIDLTRGSDLNRALAFTGMEPEPTVGTCAICGRPLTQVGPKGECLRCLADLGFLSGSQEPGQSETSRRLTPGPLKYDHFEVEVGVDGFPIELGSGAIAITYRARDTVLNSVVALKVIDRKVAKMPGVRSRFLREARAAAQIRHPNVARGMHYGEQDGECFYVMELVEGETLEAKVRREGPLPLALALEIIEQVARALAAAEACGVVHRDIKPSNIMLERDPGGCAPIVKVIDYGVAKVLASATAQGADQTQTGFIGTPAFASPEQFVSVGQTPIDTRADIYSLGATFWYLLAGRVPFVGRTLRELNERQQEPLPVAQFNSFDVPSRVLGLLKSMLAPDPKDRPQTARELLSLIHRCYTRFSTEARARRRRFMLAAAGATAVVGAIAIGMWLYQRAQSSAQIERSIAVLPFENRSEDKANAYFAEGIQDEILTRLSKIADLKVISRTSTQHYKSAPENLPEIGKQLGVAHVLEGSVQRSGDGVRVNVQLIKAANDSHLWADTFDRKLTDIFSVESEVAKAIADQLRSRLTGQEEQVIAAKPTDNPQAYDAYLRGLSIEHQRYSYPSYQAAAAEYKQAVQLDPKFALAWAHLGFLQSFLYFNGVDTNTNSAAAVKEAADQAMTLQPDLAEAWIAQGAYRYRVLRDFASALQAYEEGRKRQPNLPLVYEFMAWVERRLGRWKEAEEHFKRAVTLDPQNFSLFFGIGAEFLNYLRRFDEAQAALNRCLEISPSDEGALAAKANLFQTQGRLQEAAATLSQIPADSTLDLVALVRSEQAILERRFDDAIAVLQRKLALAKPGELPSTSSKSFTTQLGYCQEWAGRPNEAHAAFLRALQAFKRLPDAMVAPKALELPEVLALTYAGLGEKEKALAQAKQAVADYADDALAKPLAEVALAQVQARFGDFDAAIAALPHLMAVPAGITPALLRLDPMFDPLRNDPRFQKLASTTPETADK